MGYTLNLILERKIHIGYILIKLLEIITMSPFVSRYHVSSMLPVHAVYWVPILGLGKNNPHLKTLKKHTVLG